MTGKERHVGSGNWLGWAAVQLSSLFSAPLTIICSSSFYPEAWAAAATWENRRHEAHLGYRQVGNGSQPANTMPSICYSRWAHSRSRAGEYRYLGRRTTRQ